MLYLLQNLVGGCFMKGMAIKITSGLLVVALVVVVALAISGVFGGNVNNNQVVANAEASVENTQVLNGVQSNQVFYITCTKTINDLSSFVVVKDSEGNNVNLAIANVKDEKGNIGFVPTSGSWIPGVAYKISLTSSSVAFADEKYAGLKELIFVVDAEDVSEYDLKDNVVELNANDFRIVENGENSWTLDIFNLDAKYSDNTVFVYQSEIGEEGKRIEGTDEVVTNVAYKLDPNTVSSYNPDSRTMTATVVSAEVDDIYEVLNVHQSNIGITEDSFSINEEATLQSVYSSDWFLSTVQYLYGEQLGTKEFDVGEYGSFKIDYNFNKGKPANATVDLTLTFKGFLKSAKDASVTIKLANKLTPNAKVNFQKDPKAFDLAITADLETTFSVNGGFEYHFNNTDSENNTEANLALKNIVNNVCEIVKDSLNTTNGTDKPFIFATWVIPVGTTPIQIVENMGIEVKSDVKAKLSTSAKNVVRAEFGVAYVDNNVTPYFNIDDEFNFNGLTLTGTWENKVGLYNEIGISACGVVSINLGVSFGVYLDLAGRLEMDGWSIMNEELNIVPAYYVELGLYSVMNVNGKVWKINIAQQTFLNKKWPLWNAGYKYVPQTRGNNDAFADETVYLSSSYFYLTKFDTYAIDIQNPDKEGAIYSIDWDEFNYEYDESLLSIKDNKVRVTATAPATFETDIKVTSKVNKMVSKTITVVKAADKPTADDANKDYVKESNSDLIYVVHLNTSKFIGLSLDGKLMTEGVDYSYDDEILTINSSALSNVEYGAHELVFESSKGYLVLTANVVTNKNIVPDGGFKATFDKASSQAVKISMPLYGNTIKSVGLADGAWSYSKSTEEFRVNTAALMNSTGEAFVIEYSNGENATVNIEVVDNRLPMLKTTAYDYNLSSNSNLPLDIVLYENTITKVMLGNRDVTSHLNGTVIAKEAFDGVPQGTIAGKLLVAGTTYNFTVNVGVNNMLVVNAKTAVYDKAQPSDVVFGATIPQGVTLTATINGSKCASFTQNANSLTISKEYFANLQSGEYVFTVSGAENEVQLKVTVMNTTDPSMKDSTVQTVNKSQETVKTFKWNLQETDVNKVYVVGLDEACYTIDNQGLVLNVTELNYGAVAFTVYTEVNSFEFSLNVIGEMKFTTNSYNFKKNENSDLNIYVDMADKTFSEVRVMSGKEEIELSNTQLRYIDGVITLSNDYAYNLKEGKYDLVLCATDGSEVTGAVLNVIGELPKYDSVTQSNGTKESPYVIYTKEQFLTVAKSINSILSKYITHTDFEGVYFELGADIDLDYAEIDPIGTEKVPFKGSFDGNGYTIQNFKINDVNDGYTGLFAYNNGTIQNLRLVNVSVDVAKHGSVGIGLVVGYNKGTVKNVSVVTGSIKAVSQSWKDIMNAYFDIGGIVAYNEGTIARVNAEVEIYAEVKGLKVAGINIGGRKSYINVGAIVGYFKSGSVSRCTVSASIDAVSHNDSVTTNGWYGNTELDEAEIAESVRRCKIYSK